MIALNTDSLKGYGLNRIFELTKAAEYDAIDLSINFKQYDTFNAEYLNSISDKYQLPIHALSAPEIEENEKATEIINLAIKLAAKVVIFQPPKLFNRKLSSWFKKEVPKLREQEGISIALENSPGGTKLGMLPQYAMSNIEDLKKFKHVCLDTSRIGEKQQDLLRTYETIKTFLVHVHLSNLKEGKKYAPPQDGIIPLESFLTKLKQDDYPGALSIKVLPSHLNAGDDQAVIEELKKIKTFCESFYTNSPTQIENPPASTENVNSENPESSPQE